MRELAARALPSATNEQDDANLKKRGPQPPPRARAVYRESVILRTSESDGER